MAGELRETNHWVSPRVSGAVHVGWDTELAFLTSSQMVLMLLIVGPHFGNQGIICGI